MGKVYLLVMVFMVSLCNAKIIETNSIFDVEKHLDEQTLLIYDLDNTLMETAQTLGSDQWFYHRWMQLKNDMGDSPKVLDRVLSEWGAIQTFTDVKEVQSGTSEMILDQQNRKVPMIGLTTRDLSLATCTLNQLDLLKIDLAKTTPIVDEYFFRNADTHNEEKSVLFRNGILFTSGSHKGRAFLTLLKKTGLWPKKVLFINDKWQHLRQVEETCEEEHIPFIGLRYSYLDAKIEAFDHSIAELQVDHFGLILSDEEAKDMLIEGTLSS